MTGLPIDSHCEVKEPSCSLNRHYYGPPPEYFRYQYPCQVSTDGIECNPPVYDSTRDFFPVYSRSDVEYKIRGSKLQRQCECKMRNGLQPDCKRYSHGVPVLCKCLPMPEILKPAGRPLYDIVPLNMKEMKLVKRGEPQPLEQGVGWKKKC
uniref:Uncharacterized protein n=1 Tax=Cacopsylla melanoneura TaxID=428564 RepID=A0A8D8R1W6_9HEMI